MRTITMTDNEANALRLGLLAIGVAGATGQLSELDPELGELLLLTVTLATKVLVRDQ